MPHAPRTHPFLTPALILLAALALPALAAAQGHAGHGAHGAPQPPAASPRITTGFTPADISFIKDMIGHHAQAVVMADLASRFASSPMVRSLALRIDISQRDEILFMQEWLTLRGASIPDMEHAHHMSMPGMVSATDMARLEAARGPDFDHLFLELMIEHHLGALGMVDTLFATPGAGQDPDLFRFATDVGADQLDEIDVMERILDRLSTPTQRSNP
jgi:uncharacterized protein (DUF305 family)